MLIVGLGNIGKKYEKTRHNMGFEVIDRLSEKLSISFKKKECGGVLAETTVKGERIYLLKPSTFMNLSGEAVASALAKKKQDLSDLIVVSDDIDLPLGAIRIRKNGGAGTHNGMRNILQVLGSGEFARFRMGVGKPIYDMDLADFVLSKFSKAQWKTVEQQIDDGANGLLEIINGRSIDLVMGDLNKG